MSRIILFFKKLISPVGLLILTAATTLVFSLTSHFVAREGRVSVTFNEDEKVSGLPPRPKLMVSDVNGNWCTVVTGLRIKEAFGLTLALSTAYASETANRRPAGNPEAILRAMEKLKMPPGLVYSGSGNRLSTALSNLEVRFQAEPFGLELVSVGKKDGSGLPLLVRFVDVPKSPASQEKQLGIELYGYPGKEKPVPTPVPFAQAYEVKLAGWENQPVDATELSETELANLENWLQQNKF